MKKRIIPLIIAAFALTACGSTSEGSSGTVTTSIETDSSGVATAQTENTIPGEKTELESGLSYAEFEGDYRFDKFLAEGGAESDTGVIAFLPISPI